MNAFYSRQHFFFFSVHPPENTKYIRMKQVVCRWNYFCVGSSCNSSVWKYFISSAPVEKKNVCTRHPWQILHSFFVVSYWGAFLSESIFHNIQFHGTIHDTIHTIPWHHSWHQSATVKTSEHIKEAISTSEKYECSSNRQQFLEGVKHISVQYWVEVFAAVSCISPYIFINRLTLS